MYAGTGGRPTFGLLSGLCVLSAMREVSDAARERLLCFKV